MGKLQSITRGNGSVIHNVTIPKEIIDELKWNKGDSLAFEVKERNKIVIMKE